MFALPLALLFFHLSARLAKDSTVAANLVDTAWYQPPFQLKVGGIPFDVTDSALGRSATGDSEFDGAGHAAPFLADLDGKGVPDLVVGTFLGTFRRYPNVGTAKAPRFSKDWTWLRGDGEVARVPIYCCVAPSPQLVDIDGDGIPDLSSGSYDPGALYWWKGLGHGRFGARHMLTDQWGIPLFVHLDKMATQRFYSFMTNPAWGDFYGTGHPDLVVGEGLGKVYLLKNLGNNPGDIKGRTPVASQPTFQSFAEGMLVTLDGKHTLPNDDWHATPAVADWDGDGLLDILVAGGNGAVYLFRNSGTKTQPVFKTCEMLIPPGAGVEQWVEPGQQPRPGIMTEIQVVDYNGDGKPDILLGDFEVTQTPRANLTAQEKKKLQDLRTQLAALDLREHYDYQNWRHKSPYVDDPAALKQAQELRRQMLPYLQHDKSDDNPNELVVGVHSHGRIWVYLNNGKGRLVSHGTGA